MENLLVHIQAVAVNAAHISYVTQYCLERGWSLGMPSNISLLLQNIKLIDPQAYETYIRVLTIAKVSLQLHSPIPDEDCDPLLIMKDFVDFLLWNLWEILNMSICQVTELQLFYEGLRLLRTPFSRSTQTDLTR